MYNVPRTAIEFHERYDDMRSKYVIDPFSYFEYESFAKQFKSQSASNRQFQEKKMNRIKIDCSFAFISWPIL